MLQLKAAVARQRAEHLLFVQVRERVERPLRQLVVSQNMVL